MNTLRPVPVLAELSTRESTRKPQIEAHPSVAASDSEARESTQRETIVTDGTESQSLTLAAGRFNLASGKTDCAGDHNTLVKLVPFLVSASKAGTARHQFQSWCPCQGNDNQVQPSVGETAGKQKAETVARDRHLNTCRQRGRNSLASNTSWVIPQGTARSRANFVAPIAITLALKGTRQVGVKDSPNASHKGCRNRATGRGDLARLYFASGTTTDCGGIIGAGYLHSVPREPRRTRPAR